MGKLKWYKRDPNAALVGMNNLTLEETGAYNIVLDLMYARDGTIPDDDRWISSVMRVDVRVWRRIRARLFVLNKLYLVDGTLRNSRTDVEVSRGLSRMGSTLEVTPEPAQKSITASSKNKDLDEKSALENAHTTRVENKKEGGGEARFDDGGLISQQAFELADRIRSIMGVQNDDDRWYGLAPRLMQCLADGWDPELDIIDGVKHGMKGRSGPPQVFRFFEVIIARRRAERQRPLPDVIPIAGAVYSPRTFSPRPGSKEHVREENIRAYQRLKEYAESGPDGDATRGGVRGETAEIIPIPQRARS